MSYADSVIDKLLNTSNLAFCKVSHHTWMAYLMRREKIPNSGGRILSFLQSSLNPFGLDQHLGINLSQAACLFLYSKLFVQWISFMLLVMIWNLHLALLAL